MQQPTAEPANVVKSPTFENVEVHEGISESQFKSRVLNREVNNDSGLVWVDLCTLENGTKHAVISMHHALFDHQGMMNFIQARKKEKIMIFFMFCLGKLALRGHPAVTRLTVYRWLQVMRPVAKQPALGPKLCVARTGFKHDILRIVLSDLDKIQE